MFSDTLNLERKRFHPKNRRFVDGELPLHILKKPDMPHPFNYLTCSGAYIRAAGFRLENWELACVVTNMLLPDSSPQCSCSYVPVLPIWGILVGSRRVLKPMIEDTGGASS